MSQIIILNENTRTEGESGAGRMRNRCAFTPRDMGNDWPESFTYAIVLGWDFEEEPDEDSAMSEQAEKHGWDAEIVAFLRDTRERFKLLSDKAARPEGAEGEWGRG